MSVSGLTRLRGSEAVKRVAHLFDGRFRVAFVLFGGMLALQSSQNLDGTKLAYLVGTVICLVGALAALWHRRRTRALKLRFQWIASSIALAALISISFFVARGNGISITAWVRDVAAYGLFAAVPVFAMDAQASAPRKLLVGMLVLAGLLGGLSWAVEWLSRRHILDLPFARLAFPSGQLPGMLYLFAMATAFTTVHRRAAWVALAGVTLGLFLLTGTRASLLLLVGPLAMGALAGRARIRSSVRTVVLHGVVALAVVVAFQLALALPVILGRAIEEPGSSEPGNPSPAATLGPSVLGDRIWSLPGLLGNPASDASFRERAAQYEAAWALFVSSPVIGVGPGHSIDWIDVSGYPRRESTADTPLVMPAKFGLLGILVFLGAVLAYGSTMRTALRRDRRSVVTLTLVGYGVWTIVGIPLGFVIEDKGASLALMLLLAVAFAERTAPQPVNSLPPSELRVNTLSSEMGYGVGGIGDGLDEDGETVAAD